MFSGRPAPPCPGSAFGIPVSHVRLPSPQVPAPRAPPQKIQRDPPGAPSWGPRVVLARGQLLHVLSGADNAPQGRAPWAVRPGRSPLWPPQGGTAKPGTGLSTRTPPSFLWGHGVSRLSWVVNGAAGTGTPVRPSLLPRDASYLCRRFAKRSQGALKTKIHFLYLKRIEAMLSFYVNNGFGMLATGLLARTVNR